MRILLVSALLAFTIGACDTGVDGPIGGRYDVALRAGDEVVATGSLTVHVTSTGTDPAEVSGRWRLTDVRSGRPSEGDVRGRIDGTSVSFSLLLGEGGAYVHDAGYGLDGTVEGEVILGTWYWGMAAGPAGTFEARR